MTKHRSPFSVDYQTPVFLAPNDPRNKDEATFEKYRARIGRDVETVETNVIGSPLLLNEWTGGWYLRTVQSETETYGTDGLDIISNNTNVFISTDYISMMVLGSNGRQSGELLNYVNNVWKFAKTFDNGILAFGELDGEFLEAYYILERFLINSARFFPNVPYNLINATGAQYGDMYISLNTATETSILKYLMSENKEWEKTLNVVCGNNLCVDTENRLYACNDDPDNIIISAFEIDGTVRWVKQITGMPNNNGKIVKLLASSGIYIVGYCGDVVENKNLFVINLDFDGNLIWSNTYDFNLEVFATSAATNGYGILVSGAIKNSGIDSDGFIMEIGNTGLTRWSQKIKSEGITGEKQDIIHGCASDASTNYISGIILKDGGIDRAFAAATGGFFPVGTYSLEGYSFNISNVFFSKNDIALTIVDTYPTVSTTSKISINAPDGMYGGIQ